AGLGLYGLTSYLVGTRGREIGIRVALGETSRSVRARIVREGLRVAGQGAAGGIVLAGLTLLLARRFLFAPGLDEAAVLLGACLVVFAASALASYLPSRRATRIDPSVALRME
ncbi:MAG: permease, partial [Gemmatimonadetes bacterium]|nr:permease [Gemmatimonadota bacterium]